MNALTGNRSRYVKLLPFLFFSFMMLLKSCLAYVVVFEGGFSSVWKAIWNELPFVVAVFCLIEFFASKRKFFWYMAANLLLTGILFAVIMYYQYYGVIVTWRALDQVNQVTAVQNSVFSLLHPYFLLIFADNVLIFLLSFRKRFKQRWAGVAVWRTSRTALGVLFVLSLFISLMNVYPNRASMNEIAKAERMGILNYEAFEVVKRDDVEPVAFESITQEAIDRIKGAAAPVSPVLQGAAKGKNVILIQLESVQEFLVGMELDGKEIMPNLNRLAQGNFRFNRIYQNVGPGNTSDAEFVVNTSFYIPPDGPASGVYADKAGIPSLPRLLGHHGYDTATFHTNDVEFWNRSAMYPALGFDRYYDAKFFGGEDQVFFGASDEVLYRKTSEELRKMNESGKPFYAQVISQTAHHPYTIPESKHKMELPERYEGTMVGDYIRAQNYADFALGQFIDELKQSGVWDDSLIVVYGDHLGLPVFSLGSREKELMEEILGREYGYPDMIRIPLIIAADGITSPAEFVKTGGQVDFLPTIANLLGVSLEDQLHFGQDLLNLQSNLIPQRYYLPSGSFLADGRLFIPETGFEDGAAYDLENGEPSADGVSEEQYDRALKLLHYSDSYLSQLADRTK